MKNLKNLKFWIPAIPVAIIVLVVLGVSVFSDRVLDQQENTVSRSPVSTESSTTATESANSQSVTINSIKLANNYFVYEKSEYEKVKSVGRPIFLFFHANWCPTCAKQEPIVVSTFNSSPNSDVIGFRVNYNDSDTSDDEDALAEELGVRYQHTMFTLDRTGAQMDKFLGDTSESKLKESFAKVD